VTQPLQKWGLERLEGMLVLDRAPESVQLFAPPTVHGNDSGFRTRINGTDVDLVQEASDMEFVAFLVQALRTEPREARVDLLRAIG
jgi:hypothetical protein